MSDLIDSPEPGQNAHEFSVSEISGAVKRVIEGEFGRVRVKGEVGRVFVARSGHLYFDLKDDRNVLASVSWKGQVASLTTRPEEGMEVVATGRLTTFGSQSKYQLNVEDLRPAGVGALMAMLEKRKAALAAEGLFAEERKRPLPYLPEVIGVVTSPAGAVIRDILHRLRERFPRKVLVWPVAVQGQAAAPEVARAIEGFNALTPGGALPRPDLLIVARGGGSIEDLWGFNEEIVARAAAASQIPLISAVGHETDTTLIDYVSDKRAPTPTAAAELAVPVRLDLLRRVDENQSRLTTAQTRRLADLGAHVAALARALPQPEALLAQARQRLDLRGERLGSALSGLVARQRTRLATAGGGLRPSGLRQRIATDRQRLEAASRRLDLALAGPVGRGRTRLENWQARLDHQRPDTRDRRVALGRTTARLTPAIRRILGDQRTRLGGLDRLSETLSYRATLARGYAVVRGEGGVVTTVAAARAADRLSVEFSDGQLDIVGPAEPGPAPRRRKADPKADPKPGPKSGRTSGTGSDGGDQGSLF